MVKKQFFFLLLGAALCIPTSYAMEDQAHEYESTETKKTTDEHPLKDNDIVTIQLLQNIAKINQHNFEKEKEYDETMHIIEGNDVDSVKEHFTIPYKVIKNCTTLRNFIVKTSDHTGEITLSEDQTHNFEFLKQILPLLEILAGEILQESEKEQKLVESIGTITKQELLIFLDFANYLNCEPLYNSFIKFMHQKLQHIVCEKNKAEKVTKFMDKISSRNDDLQETLSNYAFNKNKAALTTIVTSKEKIALKNYGARVCFFPDNVRFAAGGEIWDLTTNKRLHLLNDDENENIICISPDERKLVSCSPSRSLMYIRDTKNWQPIHSLPDNYTGWSNKLACFSPEGEHLASIVNEDIKIWNTSDYTCLQTMHFTIEGFSQHVSFIVFSPNSKFLASGTSNGAIKIWDTTNYECVKTLEEHSNKITSLAFSPDGKFLASASIDNTIKIWNTYNYICLHTITTEKPDWLYSVAFSPNGNLLASAGLNGIIKIYNMKTYKCIHAFQEHYDLIRSIAFSHDGSKLIASSDDFSASILTFLDCNKELTFTSLLIFDYLMHHKEQKTLHILKNNEHLNKSFATLPSATQQEFPELLNVLERTTNWMQIKTKKAWLGFTYYLRNLD